MRRYNQALATHHSKDRPGATVRMPIYEYLCESCGHRFDVRQSFSDDPLTECTECGAPVRRVLHPAGVIFKGSGWYINDSRKSQSDGDSKRSGSESGGDAGANDTGNKRDASTKTTSNDAAPSESKATETPSKAAKQEPAASSASD